MPIDYQKDKDKRIFRAKLLKYPSFLPLIKEASVDSGPIEDVDILTSEAFADPETKSYPIHTRIDAITSSLYMQGEEIPVHIKTACQNMLDAYGIAIQFEEPEEIEKTASAELEEDDFALPHRGKLPIVDKDSLVKSLDIFMSNTNRLSYSDRVIGSTQFIKKASELGIEPDGVLKSMALDGYIDIPVAVKVLFERELTTGDSRYEKVASALSGFEQDVVYDRGNVIQLMSTLSKLDAEHGIDTRAENIIVPSKTDDDLVKVASEALPFSKIEAISKSAKERFFGLKFEDDLSRDDLEKLASKMDNSQQEVLLKWILTEGKNNV